MGAVAREAVSRDRLSIDVVPMSAVLFTLAVHMLISYPSLRQCVSPSFLRNGCMVSAAFQTL